jgi:hypothetical protein
MFFGRRACPVFNHGGLLAIDADTNTSSNFPKKTVQSLFNISPLVWKQCFTSNVAGRLFCTNGIESMG